MTKKALWGRLSANLQPPASRTDLFQPFLFQSNMQNHSQLLENTVVGKYF